MRLEDRRVVGRDVALPPLGVGTAPFGWLFRSIGEDEAVATATAAFDAGIRYADTAPGYGLGLAERRLGLALGARPEGHGIVVSTKVGRLLRRPVAGTPPRFPCAPDLEPVPSWGPGDARRSIEESLGRLGVDRVDIAFAHDPDDAEAELRSTTLPELVGLRDEGLIGAIGVGMNQSAMPAALIRDDLGIDVVLVAGRYSLLVHTALDDLLPAAAEHGVGVVLGGVLGTGILASDDPGARFDYRPADDAVRAMAAAIRAACGRHGVDPLAAALQFPFGHPAVVAVVAGMRTPGEAAADAAAFQRAVPSGLWDELRELGALPDQVPTP